MICSIDAEQCEGGISLLSILPALLETVVLMAIALVVIRFGQILGGITIVIIGGAIVWSVGILQAAFVLSFVPPAFVAWLVGIMTSERSPRIWHTVMWVALALGLGGYGTAIFAHDWKLVAIAFNLSGAGLGMFAMARTKWPAVSKDEVLQILDDEINAVAVDVGHAVSFNCCLPSKTIF